MKERVLGRVSEIARHLTEDDVLTLSAALSFYTALSLSPLLVLMLWLAKQLGFQNQAILVEQIVRLVGPEAGKVVGIIVENARQQPTLGSIAGAAGFLALVLSAGGVFGQLQMSLNRIFRVPAVEKTDWRVWLKKRLLSAGMVLSLGFVGLVSLVVSSVVAFLSANFSRFGIFGDRSLMLIELAGSTLVFFIFFTSLYKFLPDVELRWRDVWKGGLLTAVLFSFGKHLIGIYLGQSTVGSAFGAAGSLLVMLVWVYYSAAILFIGAEITVVWEELGHKRDRTSPLDVRNTRSTAFATQGA